MPVGMIMHCPPEHHTQVFMIKAFKGVPFGRNEAQQWFIQYKVPNLADRTEALKTFCDLKVSECNRYSSWVLKPETIKEICKHNSIPEDSHFIVIG
jgi:hypothetical protein